MICSENSGLNFPRHLTLIMSLIALIAKDTLSNFSILVASNIFLTTVVADEGRHPLFPHIMARFHTTDRVPTIRLQL